MGPTSWDPPASDLDSRDRFATVADPTRRRGFRMATRRAFLSRVGAVSAAAAFSDRALEVVEAAGSTAGNAEAKDLAANEDYWREIQGAFTLDRTMINL